MIETTEIFASPFNHCSVACPCDTGTLIAWYSGIGECHDSQSVHLIFINQNQHSAVLRIGDKTGNPILWRSGDDILLLWSKFEDNENIVKPIDRWKYCSLWVQKVIITDKPELIGEPERISNSNKNLLARCPPVVYNGMTLLPLYDEIVGSCVILNGSDFNELSRFGEGMIQPTLWVRNDKLHALSRNFRVDRIHAQYVQSVDGKSWSSPIDTNIYNNNSSICVANWNKVDAAVWNNTQSAYRRNLSLGFLNRDYECLSATMIYILNPHYGSYPCCVVHNNKLHVTFTNLRKRIEYHVWGWEDIRAAYRKRSIRYTSGRGNRHHQQGQEESS